ncbi:hypothetical protein [Bacillus phage CP-51]|uniref:Uncharacterized protein n=1 Tax=Bacillus phage CP-51 TaxID=1391188 RepID=A0A068EPC8_9CAUD|nr:hypothetical protein OZ73_gp119 [Bacillus phage CP-51]AID50554.1 hypothetical protein [Bacillus phage CP-51]
MPKIEVAFKPGSTMMCTTGVSLGSAIIPAGTLGTVETVSVDRKEGVHYTVYFNLVLTDGDREEEDVPYIFTEERLEGLGIDLLVQAL